MKQSNKCPKCGKKLSPFYMKQNCPECGANLMYYKLDERLEADAKQAQKEVDAVNRFANMLKESTIKTPWHIIRLVMFFTPLASMCLPMFWAGHKKVSLITFIMSIINHGFDMGAIIADKSYLFAILAIIMVIICSLAVIISSLFSSTKSGFKRNMIFSNISAVVFIILSILVRYFNGRALIGFVITAIIYALEFLLHYLCEKPNKRKGIACIVSTVILIISLIINVAIPSTTNYIRTVEKEDNILRVVSFNVAAPWGSSFDGTASEERVNRFADYMKAVSPDLIGTQELNSEWLEKLGKLLPEYESYAVKRGGDSDENTSEMNGIFWNKEVFTAIETKTFWLSQTPEKESRFTFTDENGKTKEAGCNRICSYAILKDNNNKKYAFLNTHLDNLSEEAKIFGAQLISDRIETIKAEYGDIKIILTGDFNQTEGDAVKEVSKKLINTQLKNTVSKATYQEWGYRLTGNTPIDYIFTDSSQSCTDCGYLDDLSQGYISDHYGIYSDMAI